MCLGKLGNPWWDDSVEANANACNDSCADEHVGVLAGGHQGEPIQTPFLRPSLSPTQPVSFLVFLRQVRLLGIRTSNKPSPHRTEVVCNSQPALLGSISDLAIGTDIGHDDKSWGLGHSPEHTLVIAFKYQGNSGE